MMAIESNEDSLLVVNASRAKRVVMNAFVRWISPNEDINNKNVRMALYYPDMRDTDFNEGDEPNVVYYGAECTPYSEAGTKRGHLHPAAYHVLVGIDVRVHHNVKWIACKNVLNSQKLDHQHGMYTMWRRYAAMHGYCFIRRRLSRHHPVGGYTDRQRCLWWLERASLSAQLGAWEAPAPATLPPTPVRTYLRASTGGRQYLKEVTVDEPTVRPPHAEPSAAQWAAVHYHVRWGVAAQGSQIRQQPWTPGEWVLRSDHHDAWRTIVAHKHHLELAHSDRSVHGQEAVRYSKIASRVLRPIDIYSVDGLVPSLTAYQEEPLRPWLSDGKPSTHGEGRPFLMEA